MKQFIQYVARALVAAPDEVEVLDGGEDEEGRSVVELRVAIDDRGKVIGKKGRMAHSLRTLLAAASPPDKIVTLDIVD